MAWRHPAPAFSKSHLYAPCCLRKSAKFWKRAGKDQDEYAAHRFIITLLAARIAFPNHHIRRVNVSFSTRPKWQYSLLHTGPNLVITKDDLEMTEHDQ